jgi:transposase
MLSVGADTHLKTHTIEVQNDSRKVVWRGTISNSREGLDRLLAKLKQLEQANSDCVAGVYMNPTGNYYRPIEHFLKQNGYNVVPAHPKVSDAIRSMVNLNKEKSDRVDASVLASTPWHEESFLERKGHERDALSELTRAYERLVQTGTEYQNAIQSCLAAVFPELLSLIGDFASKTAIALLKTCPTPKKMLELGEKKLLSVISKASRGQKNAAFVAGLRKAASESIGIPDDDDVFACKIGRYAGLLEYVLNEVESLDKEITSRTESNETVKFIDDVKGVDRVSAAAIVSEIGGIGQFDNEEKLISYCGYTPEKRSSGGKEMGVRINKKSNRYLYNAVSSTAWCLVKHNVKEFKAAFDREIGKGKTEEQAYIIVGKRFIRRVYSISKNRLPYRELMPVNEAAKAD